jgi:RND superfamily putative drug exporter
VADGVASTAKIISGAALIIVAVFAGFARGQLLQFQEMGFGVAAALILDATLIRLVILPSTLSLLGQRSWYLPRWLDWLPHLQMEPSKDGRQRASGGYSTSSTPDGTANDTRARTNHLI